MIRTQVQLTEEQVQAMNKRAFSRHVSMARLIRQAVVDSLIQSSPQVDPEERRSAIVGSHLHISLCQVCRCDPILHSVIRRPASSHLLPRPHTEAMPYMHGVQLRAF